MEKAANGGASGLKRGEILRMVARASRVLASTPLATKPLWPGLIAHEIRSASINRAGAERCQDAEQCDESHEQKPTRTADEV
jgi:hypothetical protein